MLCFLSHLKTTRYIAQEIGTAKNLGPRESGHVRGMEVFDDVSSPRTQPRPEGLKPENLVVPFVGCVIKNNQRSLDFLLQARQSFRRGDVSREESQIIWGHFKLRKFEIYTHNLCIFKPF